MGVYESAYRREHDSSVLSLYCHWFMSLFAFMECIARYAIHIGGLVVVTVFYYFYVCITCGKNHLSFRALLTTQSRLFGLYWGLSCGIFWNIGTSVIHILCCRCLLKCMCSLSMETAYVRLPRH